MWRWISLTEDKVWYFINLKMTWYLKWKIKNRLRISQTKLLILLNRVLKIIGIGT